MLPRRLALLAVGAMIASTSFWRTEASDHSQRETPEQRAARIAWWREGRLGLFIHWGPVSLKGTEISWSRANSNTNCPNRGQIPVEVYDNLFREFNPTNFNAEEWAGLASDAGAKYVVLTAKHCDGFLLWHSRTGDYHIGNTPFQRDVCAELSEAVRRKGLHMGWYFSPMDWRHADFRTERNGAFLNQMQAQLREVLSNYGRIDLLWFDWDGGDPLYDQPSTYRIAKNLQPHMVINNRLDLGKGDSDRKILSSFADYYTPEQQLGSFDDRHPWETCMTLGTQWAWKPNDTLKSLPETINILLHCAGGDGNLLLNVGPMPDGSVEPRQAEILRGLGNWLNKYGQSIYGTRGGPYKPGEYGASTRAGRTVYLHVTDWLGGELSLPPIPAKVIHHRVLTGGTAKVIQTDKAITVSVPEQDRDPIDTIIALGMSAPLDFPAVDVPAAPSLCAGAKATASNTFSNQEAYGPAKAVDGNKDTRWAADAGVHTAWLELDLGRPVSFGRVRLSEAFPNRVQKFELQRWFGGEWKTFYSDRTIGRAWTRSFTPVTAERVRLNVLESTDGPTIWDFSIYSE